MAGWQDASKQLEEQEKIAKKPFKMRKNSYLLAVSLFLTSLGFIVFVVYAMTAPFSDELYSSIFPKDSSFASGNCMGDVDGDGDVDIFDLGIVAGHYGETCEAGTPTPTPEDGNPTATPEPTDSPNGTPTPTPEPGEAASFFAFNNGEPIDIDYSELITTNHFAGARVDGYNRAVIWGDLDNPQAAGMVAFTTKGILESGRDASYLHYAKIDELIDGTPEAETIVGVNESLVNAKALGDISVSVETDDLFVLRNGSQIGHIYSLDSLASNNPDYKGDMEFPYVTNNQTNIDTLYHNLQLVSFVPESSTIHTYNPKTSVHIDELGMTFEEGTSDDIDILISDPLRSRLQAFYLFDDSNANNTGYWIDVNVSQGAISYDPADVTATEHSYVAGDLYICRDADGTDTGDGLYAIMDENSNRDNTHQVKLFDRNTREFYGHLTISDEGSFDRLNDLGDVSITSIPFKNYPAGGIAFVSNRLGVVIGDINEFFNLVSENEGKKFGCPE